ncbi:unnamed protein product [Polarella glacialis]|uniref:Cytochrome b559 subunit beta n=1 Tax=Polarella glacialis TaxID=89957 RepID=A0A813ELT7_POLGL|nr:unnamed protein product [Polarella glacialis]CAE8686148.1 unnamed protein product [Polarella glacialis]
MMQMNRVLSLLAFVSGAAAFVAPSVQQRGAAAPAVAAGWASAQPALEAETDSTWGCVLAGLGLGYGAAAASAFARVGKVARQAEKMPTVRTPVAYPIFTFRWLAIHALAVPVVFFLGAISSMQFIQR